MLLLSRFLLYALVSAKKTISNLGLTIEEGSLIQEDLRKRDHEAATQRIVTAQERQRQKIIKATGVDVEDIIPDIGREISWSDVVNHAFRVLEFDRNNTTIDRNGQVKVKSAFQPYGYLFVESPILNQK